MGHPDGDADPHAPHRQGRTAWLGGGLLELLRRRWLRARWCQLLLPRDQRTRQVRVLDSAGHVHVLSDDSARAVSPDHHAARQQEPGKQPAAVTTCHTTSFPPQPRRVAPTQGATGGAACILWRKHIVCCRCTRKKYDLYI